MQQLDLLVPEHTLNALQLTPEGMSAELRLAAAMKLHEIGRLSAGAAAELAGLSHPEFLQRLDEYNVHAFDLTEDELLRDAGNARGPQ